MIMVVQGSHLAQGGDGFLFDFEMFRFRGMNDFSGLATIELCPVLDFVFFCRLV